MMGLGGNDNYYVDNPGDVVIEAPGGGYDIVRTSVSYTLTAGSEIEQFGTTYNAGTDPINLTGNEFSQIIRGNAGDNVLASGGGNDVFTTGAGHDTIVFNVSLGSNNVITISDFDPASDQIALDHTIFTQLTTLGELDPAAFASATNATTAAQHIIYDANSGFIYYDADGSNSSPEVLFAKVTPQLALTSHDFVIV
jgi:Ca2+-binding RTX toxin-like protein